MTMREERSHSGRGLTWIALGVTIAALAFTVRPVRASSAVYGVLLLAAASIIAIGIVVVLRAARGDRGERVRDELLLSADCRRLGDQLNVFISERTRCQPRTRIGRADARLEQWRAETTRRYGVELRAWATKVFDAAVAAGAAPPSARTLVDAPSAAQLPALRDVFRDAADRLERYGDT